MILAFDTYYFADQAKTVCLAFDNWHSQHANQTYSEIISGVDEYQPGEFYKRELPCILSLLAQIKTDDLSAIIIDGYVLLDDQHKLGLGGHLYQALNQQFAIIGVAKTPFALIDKNQRPVLRGESKKPLFVTALGIDLDLAAQHIQSMYGQHRVPTLLKQLDQLTKKNNHY